MLTIEQTKIMAQASLRVYPDVGGTPDGFTIANAISDSDTGFSATVFKKTDSNEYIVAIRGTETLASDFYADINLGIPQYISKTGGQELIAWIEEKIPANSTINITGHSLGGALAES